MCECEVYVVVDAAGDYAVGTTAEGARERYEEDVQQLCEAEGFRIIKCVVSVPLPELVTLTGKAPAQGGGTLTVK